MISGILDANSQPLHKISTEHLRMKTFRKFNLIIHPVECVVGYDQTTEKRGDIVKVHTASMTAQFNGIFLIYYRKICCY